MLYGPNLRLNVILTPCAAKIHPGPKGCPMRYLIALACLTTAANACETIGGCVDLTRPALLQTPVVTPSYYIERFHKMQGQVSDLTQSKVLIAAKGCFGEVPK